MTSTLTLYKSCRIREEKLFIVDDIETYLNTLTKEVITGFQYQRQGMSLRVKINKTQSALNFIAANDFNYAKIQNDSEKVCYYFIKSKKQLADSTIELELGMDTINTFRPTTDFIISQRTKINRQHKDRFSSTEKLMKCAIDYYIGTQEGDLYVDDLVELVNYAGDAVFQGRVTYIDQYSIEIFILNPTSEEDYIYLIEPWLGERFDVINVNAPENFVAFDITSLDNVTFLTGKRYTRAIDINSEGITPLLYGENKGVLQGDNQSWYLIYKGNNPLSCYLCADDGFTATLQAANQEIIPSDLTTGVYYYILPDRNGTPQVGKHTGVDMETAEGNDVSAYIQTGNFNMRDQVVTFYYKDGVNIKVGRYQYSDIGFGFFYVRTLTTYTTSKIIITGADANPIKGNTLGVLTNNTATIRAGASYDVTFSTHSVSVYDITTLNRTDADIAKIIKLPYRPCDDNFTGWDYDSTMHMLLYKNLDRPLENDVQTSYNPLEALQFDDVTPSLTMPRAKRWESKLYHSDYYQPKFVYDSFTFIFSLERQKAFVALDNFKIIFTATGTINSRFLFTFTSYNDDGFALEDYSNILPVARNNELPIYNSDYINYIKMGFNYDVKTKQRQEAGQWVGTALSLVGSIASFASSSVTGALGVATGISLATATLGQLVNAVNSTAQAEANQAQKLHQLRQQKESVMGSDDIDLMSKYTDNKAKWMLYQVSSRMSSVLFDLFFYTGYIDGTNGIPQITTRKWFNFLSCDLVVDEDNNINSDIMNDIKAKYALGVTFMHSNIIDSVYTWDWNQEKENWETSLFN